MNEPKRTALPPPRPRQPHPTPFRQWLDELARNEAFEEDRRAAAAGSDPDPRRDHPSWFTSLR